MIEKIKKYLPDLIILIGIYIASYNLLEPPTTGDLLPSFHYTNYHTNEKVQGIMLIAIGIDIAIRRYLRKN